MGCACWAIPRSRIARKLVHYRLYAAREPLASRLQLAPQSILGGSKIHPRRHQNPPSGGSKIHPKSLQKVQERPRRKSFPKVSHLGRPKTPQERPESAPRAHQGRPRAPQERPKSAQEGPKTLLKALRGALGDHFDAYKLEKRAFRERSVARLAREARSEGFVVDFRSVRARANV